MIKTDGFVFKGTQKTKSEMLKELVEVQKVISQTETLERLTDQTFPNPPDNEFILESHKKIGLWTQNI